MRLVVYSTINNISPSITKCDSKDFTIYDINQREVKLEIVSDD